MLKLGIVATAATATTTASTLNQQPSLIRPGISYNQVVKANVVCHLTDTGTGCSEGIDMSKDIEDSLKNPGNLKQITPSPSHSASVNKSVIWETNQAKLANIFTWVNSVPEATQARIQDLTQKYLECIETLQTKYAKSYPAGIGDTIGEDDSS